jgi:hypothetical protein
VQDFKFQQAIDAVHKAEIALVDAIQTAERMNARFDTGSMILELRKLQNVRLNLNVYAWSKKCSP